MLRIIFPLSLEIALDLLSYHRASSWLVKATDTHRALVALWSNLHLPFIMSYVLSAGALARVVLAHDCKNCDPEALAESSQSSSEADLQMGIRWFYSAGLGTALACMGIIAMTHRHKVVESQRIRKGKRLAVRFVVSIILVCLPLANELNSLYLIATTTGLVFFVLCVDTYGMSAVNEKFWKGSGTCKYSAECRLRKNDMETAIRTSTLDLEELAKQDVGDGNNAYIG